MMKYSILFVFAALAVVAGNATAARTAPASPAYAVVADAPPTAPIPQVTVCPACGPPEVPVYVATQTNICPEGCIYVLPIFNTETGQVSMLLIDPAVQRLQTVTFTPSDMAAARKQLSGVHAGARVTGVRTADSITLHVTGQNKQRFDVSSRTLGDVTVVREAAVRQ